MYEHRSKPLLSPAAFFRRLAVHMAIVFGVILVSLFAGILGYREFARLSWIDSLLNASMIMGGMGPVDRLATNSAKLFASFYALYCGLVLLICVGILFAPVIHRILHKFHLETPGN